MRMRWVMSVLAALLALKLIGLMAFWLLGSGGGLKGPQAAQAQTKKQAITSPAGSQKPKPAAAVPAKKPAKESPPASQAVDPRLLQLINQRRQKLAMEETRLTRKRQEMLKLRGEVEQRINELKKVQAALEELLSAQRLQRSRQVEQLVKVISNMRPRNAAEVVAKLDDQMSVDIFRRLNSRAAGKIMNNLKAEQAARISVLIARQKEAKKAAAAAARAAARGAQPPPPGRAQPPARR